LNGGRVARGSAVLFLVFSLWAPSIAAALCAETGRPRIYALLINGGDRPGSNYQSHLHHLQDMVGLLRARGVPPARIHVFSADGDDPARDLTTRPCKSAVPEVLAMARTRGLPVLAISDEDEETVGAFLAGRTEAFFPSVAVDALRKSFIAYGVSGTSLEGWSWSRP